MVMLGRKWLLALSKHCIIYIYFSLANIGKISNESERNQLKSDLNTDDDGERKLMQISAQTASQIFEILQIKDPHCDTDHNGVIKGDEVKCLNIIWKAYLPH